MRCMRETQHASGGKAATFSLWTTSAPRTEGRASRDLARCSWRWPTQCTWPTLRRRSRSLAADDRFQSTESAMCDSSTEPVIPDQRSYAAVFSDLGAGPPRNIRRTNLATTSIHVGASYASLDVWYVDQNVSATPPTCLKICLSEDEFVKGEFFHRGLHRSA